MIPPLVVTKYTLPPPKPHQVVRERLMKRLLAGLDRKLTLITAPAGFGKSTVALAFANAADRAVAWLNLDEADNDPVRWGAYLVAAVRHAGLAVDDQVMLLAEEQTLDMLLGSLINAVAAASSPLLIVLDDYHMIHEDAIHAAVALLLDRLPPNVHVAIVSRTRPPLLLAQLKVRGELVEIGATDLRFTSAEGSAFLSRTMGLNLPAQEEAELVGRTEGWAAALQLAALSLQGDPPAAISADHPDLVAYLLGEVLNQQPEPVRIFLLQTAILDVLTGPVCTAVTGQPDGDRMLKALEQANLLVFPLDSERRAYRYHSLFAEFLRHQLPDEAIPELHIRAADWYQADGQLAEAVDHLIAGGAFDRAAGLLEHFTHASPAALRRWLDQFPQPFLRGRPHLATLAAWVLIATGDVQNEHRFALAITYLEMAEAAGESASAETRGVLAAVRTALALWAPVRQLPICIMQDAARTLQCGQQAQELLPADSWFWRSVVISSLGSVYLRAGNVSAAAKAFGEAARIGARGGDLLAALTALRQQAELLTLLGQLRQADETYREALRLAAEAGAQLLPTLAPIYLGMGRLRQTWHDLDGSAQMLAEARTRYAASGDAPPELLLAEARLHQARSDAPAADAVPDLRRIPEYLALARLLVAEGDAKTAMPLLGAVRQVAAASGCRAPEAEAQAIEALVNADLVEPLTERERAIMQLIATGCSNQDVATQLIMGVSTVKWHLVNIYGKLQVRNRTQAVARARELRLVVQ